MKHHCHVPGCPVVTKPERLMCWKHWQVVPARLKANVWKHYRHGQCDDKQVSKEWMNAANEAIKAVLKFYREENLTAQIERNNNKGRKMTTTQVLRKLFLGIAAAFSEAAGEIEEVSSGETATETAQEESTTTTKTRKPRGSKKTEEKPADKKGAKGGKNAKKDEEEMEEVDSPYNDEDQSSDDPADFDDEDGDDDFAGMEEEEEKKEATVEDLRAALVAYAQKNTKEKAYKVLEKFGAKKANEVKKADIAKAIAALKVK